ncbi:hypothetical protein [Marinobacter segnicrescens]|uniref:RIFT barrel domain-containing protein n=1 Tax=Marinobacter segnicrescens TaxID=430453 RepID=UPI003A922098
MINIHLDANDGVPRYGEVFQLGVPLRQGSLSPQDSVALVDSQTSEKIPCQASPLTTWPDGSVRWLKLQFLADLLPREQRTVQLQSSAASITPSDPLVYTRNRDGLNIDTGTARFHLPADTAGWTYLGHHEPIHHEIVLSTKGEKSCGIRVDGDWRVLDQGAVSLSCETQGWFVNGGARLARFFCRLTFYRDSNTVKVDVGLHNPKRAQHPGGLWDLGDPGSVYFEAMKITANVSNICQVRLTPEPGKPVAEENTGSMLLYQDSSGGENWNSINHVNAAGDVTTRFRGYRITADNKVVSTGDRASPIITISNLKTTIQATLPNFWQNFPSSIGAYSGQLVVGLFPGEASEEYELQGGERKTQTAYFHYGDKADALAWTLAPKIPVVDAKQYQESQAFPWFSAGVSHGPLDDLIQQGLDGSSNFFAKREIIDEYGWRNFGDIFADHETFFQSEAEPPLVSHYNNQYDAIYGFARQFALTGDRRWYELMDDLAKHVRDIDIYHTDEDRSEYNHGLFWHTDHYVPAHTATHRTYSRYNKTSSVRGQTGGGPAEEHCYTTGLLYHYLITGEAESKDAVLELACWIRTLYEGSNSLAEALKDIIRYDLPKLKAILSGQTISRHRYVFNRGTGNYLNTLIDAHLVDPGGPWLGVAERVIANTVHPADEISRRGLLAVERRWSYVVFLSSMARYLLVKGESGVYDQAYYYGLRSFCHYTRWMVRHERPFSRDPCDLSSPNGTWVAQEVRKSMLLFLASKFDPEYQPQYLEKARFFLNHVTRSLSEIESDERAYSRILIILMQNYGPHNLGESFRLPVRHPEVIGGQDEKPPNLTIAVLLGRSGLRLKKAILDFDLRKEKAWLQARLGK